MSSNSTTTVAGQTTEQDLFYLSIATLIASVLSLLGGLLISYGIAVQTHCCRCHETRSRRSRENPTITTLILSMTISDVLQSITFIAGAGATLRSSADWMYALPALCEAQGFILQVFVFATPLWVLAICVTLHRLVVNAKEGGCKFIVVVSVVCWGTALLLGIIPFTFSREAHGGWSGYGPTGAWCWIHSSSDTPADDAADNANTSSMVVQNMEQWVLFYVELLLIFFTVVGFSFNMVVHIHRQYTTSQMWGHWKKRQGVVIRRLLLFPFAFILAWSGGITNHVWRLFHPGQMCFALGMFHACTVCSQGWLNAVAYGATNQKLMRAVCEHWGRTCCCCCCRGRRGPSGNKRLAASTVGGVLHSRILGNFIDDDSDDADDDIGSELSRSTSASEMVTPARSPSASIDIGFGVGVGVGAGPRAAGAAGTGAGGETLGRPGNRDSTHSTSSIPAGTSPYSLLRM